MKSKLVLTVANESQRFLLENLLSDSVIPYDWKSSIWDAEINVGENVGWNEKNYKFIPLNLTEKHIFDCIKSKFVAIMRIYKLGYEKYNGFSYLIRNCIFFSNKDFQYNLKEFYKWLENTNFCREFYDGILSNVDEDLKKLNKTLVEVENEINNYQDYGKKELRKDLNQLKKILKTINK